AASMSGQVRDPQPTLGTILIGCVFRSRRSGKKHPHRTSRRYDARGTAQVQKECRIHDLRQITRADVGSGRCGLRAQRRYRWWRLVQFGRVVLVLHPDHHAGRIYRFDDLPDSLKPRVLVAAVVKDLLPVEAEGEIDMDAGQTLGRGIS